MFPKTRKGSFWCHLDLGQTSPSRGVTFFESPMMCADAYHLKGMIGLDGEVLIHGKYPDLLEDY